MKKKYILFPVCFLCAVTSFAQVTFQKVIRGGYESEASAIEQTTDSGFIIAGYVRPLLADNTDVYLVKTDAKGDTLWTKIIAGTYDNAANAVQQTIDGGYIIAGTSTDTADNTDLYLIKTNDVGDTLWTKSYNGVSYVVGNSVQQTYDSGYIVTGWTDSYGQGLNDVYLLKTNANGDTLWTRTYGGIGNDVGESVQQTSDSGYIVVGYTLGFGAGNADVYLIKTKANGDLLWSKTYGGTINDIGFSVRQTIDKGYIIAGQTNSFGAGDYDAYLIKTDQNGDTLWTKTYGEINSDDASEVLATSDDGYIIIGTTTNLTDSSDDVYVIKTDLQGDTLWTKAYGGSGNDDGYAAIETKDGGYVIAGYTTSFIRPQDEKEVYLIKTDALGNTSCNQRASSTLLHITATQTAGAVTITSSGASTSPNPTLIGSGGNDSTLCLYDGIHEQSISNRISLYPNPAGNQLTVYGLQLTHHATIAIYNVMGEALSYQYAIVNSQYSINVSSLPSGIYFVRATYDNELWVAKFVKE